MGKQITWRDLALLGCHMVPLGVDKKGDIKAPLFKSWQKDGWPAQRLEPTDCLGWGHVPAAVSLLVIDCDEPRPGIMPAKLRDLFDHMMYAEVPSGNGVHVYVRWPEHWGMRPNKDWKLDGHSGQIRHANGQVVIRDMEALHALLQPGALEESEKVRDTVDALLLDRKPDGARHGAQHTRTFADPDNASVYEQARRLDGSTARTAQASRRSAERSAAGNRIEWDSPVSLSAHLPVEARYCEQQNQWYLWDGPTGWSAVPDGSIDRIYNDWCFALHHAGRMPGEVLARLDQRRMINEVRLALRERGGVRVQPDDLDNDPDWCGLPDGQILNLATGDTAPPSRDLLITKKLACVPDSAAKPDAWLRFLGDALPDDDVRAWVRAWYRYCLSGRTNLHAMLFVYGPAGTGKSTLGELLFAMLGDYGRALDGEKLTGAVQGEHDAWMLPFVGSRMVYCDEVVEGGSWRSQKVKQLVSARRLSARAMRGNPFDFSPSAKLMISGNHHPKTPRTDAIWRRMHVLPMRNKPKQPDPMLGDKLRAELPGILAWALGGDLTLIKGDERPAAMQSAVDEARDEGDQLAAQLADMLTATPGERVAVKAIVEVLNDELDAMDKRWTTRRLTPVLKRLGYNVSRSDGQQFVRDYVRAGSGASMPF